MGGCTGCPGLQQTPKTTPPWPQGRAACLSCASCLHGIIAEVVSLLFSRFNVATVSLLSDSQRWSQLQCTGKGAMCPCMHSRTGEGSDFSLKMTQTSDF